LAIEIYKIFELFSLSNNLQITPDGSNRCHFVDFIVEDYSSTKVVDYIFDPFPLTLLLSSGARPVLPMGVAPEAIAEFFLGIGSNYTNYR
jgi:hypothetical protein